MSPLTKRQKILIIFLVILILALPVGVYLTQKTQIFKPRAQEVTQVHSVVNFDSKVEQILSPGDTLEGKGIPNSKVSISITPDGDSKEVDVDKDGKWSYLVPPTLQPKNYNLTIILEDITGNIASIKSYSLVIASVAKQSLNIIKPAYAQGTSTPPSCNALQFQCPDGSCVYRIPGATCPSQTTPSSPVQSLGLQTLSDHYGNFYTKDMRDWEYRLRKIAIYPVWSLDTLEIVFISREEFENTFCNKRCTDNPDFDSFIKELHNSEISYIEKLADYLRRDCYIPFYPLRTYIVTTLGSYLPDMYSASEVDKFKAAFPSLDYFTRPYPNCADAKVDMDEAILETYTKKAANEYALNAGEPFKEFIFATDGVFSTRVIFNIYAWELERYKLTNEETINATLAIIGTFPPGKTVNLLNRAGKFVSSRSLLPLRSVAKDMKAVREAIQSGNRLPVSELERIMGQNLEEIVRYEDLIKVPGEVVNLIPEGLWPTRPKSREAFEKFILPAIGAGKAWKVPANIRQEVADDLLRIYATLPGLNRTQLDTVIREGRVFILDDRLFGSICAGSSACSYGDMVVIKKSLYQTPGIRDHLLHHELIHSLSSAFGEYYAFKINFRASEKEIERLYKAFNLIYEIMSDYGADLAQGLRPLSSVSGTSAYYGVAAPELTRTIFSRLFKDRPELIEEFKRFAIIPDGQRLIRAVTGKDGVEGQQLFLQYLKDQSKINVDEILLISGNRAADEVRREIINISDPGIELGSNILIAEEENDDQIEITGVVGQGNTRAVSFICHEGGISEDCNQFDVTFALDPLSAQNSLIKTALAFNRPATISQLQALAAQRISPDSYLVTLNNSTDANLEACISRQGSVDVISCSSPQRISGISSISPSPQPTTIQSSPIPSETPTPSRQVKTIRFNNVLVYDRDDPALNNLDNAIDVHLPALTEGIPNPSAVFVNVTYSEEGQADTYHQIFMPFYYLNYVPPVSGVPNENETPTPTIEGAQPILPITPTRGPGLPAPRGQYIPRGGQCGTQSGSNSTLNCEPGSTCRDGTTTSSPPTTSFGYCVYNYSVPTPIPVNVVNPTSRPTPTPYCPSTCNNNYDCTGCGVGKTCGFGSGAVKVCR